MNAMDVRELPGIGRQEAAELAAAENAAFIAELAALVRPSGVVLVRVLAGRLEAESLEIEGDKERAVAWLRIPCPF